MCQLNQNGCIFSLLLLRATHHDAIPTYKPCDNLVKQCCLYYIAFSLLLCMFRLIIVCLQGSQTFVLRPVLFLSVLP